MATRSVTDTFMLMRTNSIQNRGIYSFQAFKHKSYDADSDESSSDKTALMEAGRAMANSIDMRSQEICPPPWAGLLEDAQYSITRLQNRIEELHSLQDTHVLRPTLDDSNLQEKQILDLTLDITKIFSLTRKTINQILSHSSGLSGNKESQLTYNVSSALIASLQNIFNKFINSQKTYRNKIKRLEGISLQMLLNTEDETSNSDLQCIHDNDSSNAFGQQLQMLQSSNQTRTFASILIEEENAKTALKWGREANQIASSIVDLNSIFKDFAHMTIQQGSILNRIDYNIEQTVIEVKKGAEELIKADKCKRSNRTINCILFIIFIIFVLLILLKLTTF